MTILKSISHFVFSPWFLAIIPSAILIFFLPHMGEKYKLTAEHSLYSSYNVIYADINSDSISELLRLDKGTPYNSLAIQDNNLNYFDQWNFPDSLVTDISKIITGNFDHDRYGEIYVFSVHEDSLFLNVNEFFDPEGIHMQHVYITKIARVQNIYTTKLYSAGFYDENGDGKDEIYFSLVTGFGLEPRHLYSFNLITRKLKSSEFTGFICMFTMMEDIDGDHRPEIFGMTSASGNYKVKTPYPDYSTWLMVFDDQLKFKFKPIEFEGFASGLTTFPLRYSGQKALVTLYATRTANKVGLNSKVMIYSARGELVKSRELDEIGSEPNPVIAVIRQKETDRILLFAKKAQVLNERLEVIQETLLPFNSYIILYQADFDGDGINELLFYSMQEEKLVIYNTLLTKLGEISIKLTQARWEISAETHLRDLRRICISNEGKSMHLSISRNTYYLLGFLVYPGIYFLIFLFILLIRNISVYQIKQRESLKRRLINLQLQSIKSQLDPHFTFNALNSVAALIYKDDRQSAYDHMNKFTQLLRRMLNDADRIYRSLREELEFVTTYLDLEKLRFGEKFGYEIRIGEKIDQNNQVPKMVLQTFAENAIKHGIMPCTEGGWINIKIENEADYLKLTVEDNGIGRTKSAGQSTSTGKGLKITDEFYQILNQINDQPIKLKITDLFNGEGFPSGTRVDVWVPVESHEKS